MDWFLYDNGLRHERVNVYNLHKMGISAVFSKEHFYVASFI